MLKKVFVHYSHLHVKEPALETNIDPFLLSQIFFVPLMAAKQY